ncbi:hypothetical protein FB446DRAFT_704818 [Lentinula raphanica]|nr:hypothetical protein FB446DRAFT_704818 [Lentinula raphanica]
MPPGNSSEGAEDDDDSSAGPRHEGHNIQCAGNTKFADLWLTESRLKIKLKLPYFETIQQLNISPNSGGQKSANEQDDGSSEGDENEEEDKGSAKHDDMEDRFSESLYDTPCAERRRALLVDGAYATSHPKSPPSMAAIATHQQNHPVSGDSRDTPQILSNLRDLGGVPGVSRDRCDFPDAFSLEYTPSRPPHTRPKAPPKFRRNHALQNASAPMTRPLKSLSPFDWHHSPIQSESGDSVKIASPVQHSKEHATANQKRGRSKKVKPLAAADSSESEVHFVEETRPKRKRCRPRKSKQQSASPEQPLPLAVALYTEIEMPRIVQRGKMIKGNKYVPQANQVSGPRTLNLDANWGDFVKVVCQTAGCSNDELVLESLRWSWVTLKEFTRTDDTFAQDESIDVDLTTLIGQKKSIDQRLEPIVEKILEKYPVGKCTEHPDIHCFKYEPNQWHFHLDSNHVWVFAMAVISDARYKKEVNGNLSEIPLSSAHFKQNQTIGYRNRHAQTSTPSTNNPIQGAVPSQSQGHAPSTPTPYPYGLPPAPMPYAAAPPFGYFPPYPHYSVYGAPPPGHPPSTPLVADTSASVAVGLHQVHSSSPVPRCDLKEWCNLMNLSETIYDGLVKLRFQVGDSLAGMPNSEWQKAGFTWLEWQRVLEAYRRYKVEMRK